MFSAGNEVMYRITPACAGKTNVPTLSAILPWDHPRVCGEKHIVNDNYKFKRGITPACAGKTKRQRSISLVRVDHPRVCGKNQKNLIYSPIIQGSPPRVREKLVLFPCLRRGCGITPACAGKTWGRSDSP